MATAFRVSTGGDGGLALVTRLDLYLRLATTLREQPYRRIALAKALPVEEGTSTKKQRCVLKDVEKCEVSLTLAR